MEGDLRLILELVFAAMMTIIAGIKLVKYGDRIGEKTDLGGLWVGLVLLSLTTSLPELVTTMGSALLDPPQVDFAIGNVLGSNLFNLLTLVLLDFVEGSGSMLVRVEADHRRTVVIGLILTLGTIGGLLLTQIPMFGPVGADSLGLGIVALMGLFLITRREVRVRKEVSGDDTTVIRRLKGVRSDIVTFILFAAITVAAGYFLIERSDQLVKRYDLAASSYGVFALAIVTSLPELVVGFQAARIGAIDMALGNIFGSNVFNIMLLPLTDLLIGDRRILSSVDGVLNTEPVAIGIIGAIMMVIVWIGLTMKSRGSIFRLDRSIAFMFLIYCVGLSAYYLYLN